MPLKSVPPSTPDSDTDVAAFEPSAFSIVVNHHDEGNLVLTGDHDDFIQRFEARVYERRGETVDTQEDPSVATIRFSRVAFGEHASSSFALKFDFADAVSGELLEIAEALFDDDANHREELELSGAGVDLLHFEHIEVVAGRPVHDLVRYALENLISRYGDGCGVAVFYQANWESIGVARPLRDRDFRQTPSNRNVWFADLGRIRPPLSRSADSSSPDE